MAINDRGKMIDPECDRRYIPFTYEQLQRLREMYREGWSTRKLAGRYGVSPCTVRRRLLKLGVKLRGTGKNHVVTDFVLATAHRMRNEGRGWRAIVTVTGVHADSIMNAMRRERKKREAMMRKLIDRQLNDPFFMRSECEPIEEICRDRKIRWDGMEYRSE